MKIHSLFDFKDTHNFDVNLIFNPLQGFKNACEILFNCILSSIELNYY